MIEAVGEENWPVYFRTLADRMKPGGVAAIQAITIDERLFETYRRKADFIQRYVFPGGMLPTRSAIAREADRAGLRCETVETFGISYARTVREWRKRFDANWPAIAQLGFDARFRRKWRYYLAYCEAGFLEGTIDVGLYRLTRPLTAA
jgi:cyclopropane-fatty-acyl-phospholipid synthase